MNPLSDFSPIAHWQDAQLFAGRIVAIQTSSRWLGNRTWRDPAGDPQLAFGWVELDPSPWLRSGLGYSLDPLWVPGAVHHNCAMTDDELAEAGLSLRLASAEEIEAIRRAVVGHEAEFNYTDGMPRPYRQTAGAREDS